MCTARLEAPTMQLGFERTLYGQQGHHINLGYGVHSSQDESPRSPSCPPAPPMASTYGADADVPSVEAIGGRGEVGTLPLPFSPLPAPRSLDPYSSPASPRAEIEADSKQALLEEAQQMTSEVAVQQQELIMALQQAEAETAALRTALQVCICVGWVGLGQAQRQG